MTNAKDNSIRTKMDGSREPSVDILRAIALLGIILIHVNPSSPFVCQLRGFDVPMMVFLSGVVFAYGKRSLDSVSSICKYEWNRIVRILFPTWFFILMYFAFVYLRYHSIPDMYEVKSYFTLKTYWYVWIMRVFLIVAMTAPVIQWLKRKLSNIQLLIIAILVLVLFEFFAIPNQDSWAYYITMAIPYILIFGFGTMIDSISHKNLWKIMAVCAVVYVVYAVWYWHLTGEYQGTQICKYPPRLYYTSYAMMCVVLLWQFRKQLTDILRWMHLDEFGIFIGSHTMWIYFWHIIGLIYLDIPLNWLAQANILNVVPAWCISSLIICIFSFAIVWLQDKVVSALLSLSHDSPVCKNILRIFRG